jgi:uncharacterized protein (TIGR02145 family)
MKRFITIIFCIIVFQFSKSENIDLNIKIFLEGPFLTDSMIPSLNNDSTIPLSQPYSGLPWFYNGTESVTAIPSPAVVDWVLVDLVKATGQPDDRNFDLVTRKAAFILTDGTIRNLDGVSLLSVDVYTTSGLYVCIHHRNHLSVISSLTVSETDGIYSYDFTTDAGKTFGEAHAIKELATGFWGMLSADGNNNGQIDNRDKNVIWARNAGTFGYKNSDFNMDNYTGDNDIDYNWSVNAGKGFTFTIRHPSMDISCGDSILDIRDGKKYKTVLIDTQCWMAENLNTGTMIQNTEYQTDNDTIEKYCYHDSIENCEVYGGLYAWNELMQFLDNSGAQGICPAGWHIPANSEFAVLINYLGGVSVAGDAMKEAGTVHWQEPNTGTNSSGFTALPGGASYEGGFFALINQVGHFWTSTEENGSQAIMKFLWNYSSYIAEDYNFKELGFSVRCLKDINSFPVLPPAPIPPDESSDQPINPTLSWACGDPENDPLKYDVYFGTTDPPYPITYEQIDTNYNPDTLDYNTIYYWKIVAHDDHGNSTEGPVWSFTTMQPPWQCGDSMVDLRDGQAYSTIQINAQCWMAENLNIGTMVSGATNMTNNGVVEKYCYDNDTANCDTYGGLYQWNEMMEYSTTPGVQGICPAGWHLPTEFEWTMIINFLGGESIAGGMMKEADFAHWSPPNTDATNISGFTGLPGGGAYNFNEFSGINTSGRWWSSTKDILNNKMDFYNLFTMTMIYNFHLGYNSANISRSSYPNDIGLSVRCLNDETAPGFPSATTSYIFNISDSSATGGGSVTTQGNSPVTARGICWSTSQYPTISDNHTVDGSGTGTFTSLISGLNADTTYYVRTYATNSTCTGYGNIVSFVAQENGGGGEPCPETPTVTYEGQVYNTVQIGSQCWFRENLNVGVMINGSNNSSNNGQTEKYCYNNEPDFCNIYGGLYRWDEMMNYTTFQGAQGICPTGWHIPSIAEWTALFEYLGGDTIAGGKMKEAGFTHWLSPNTGATNESGFTGLPGGFFNSYFYYNAGSSGLYWSSNAVSSIYGTSFKLLKNSNGISQYNSFNFKESNSVRCIKGEYINQPPSSPSTPQPPDGAVNQSINTTLAWTCSDLENDPLTFDIFFGTTNPPELALSGQSDLNYNPGALLNNSTYFWKIVAHDNQSNTTEGLVWSFTTVILCGNPITDIRDGQSYQTVQIGTQCWLAENLNIGNRIDGVNNPDNNGIIEKYCYDDIESNCDIYGGLYKWNEMMQYVTNPGTQGICPPNGGWHLPTAEELLTITDFLGGEEVAGGEMKQTGTIQGGDGLWFEPNEGATNNSGFTGLPGGYRGYDGNFYFLGCYTHFWSSTESSSDSAWIRTLFFNYPDFYLNNFTKDYGFSVRCIMN